MELWEKHILRLIKLHKKLLSVKNMSRTMPFPENFVTLQAEMVNDVMIHASI